VLCLNDRVPDIDGVQRVVTRNHKKRILEIRSVCPKRIPPLSKAREAGIMTGILFLDPIN
jgi:hypothetical protein